MKKFLYLYVSFLVLGLSLFFIINSVFAWSLPTANPPQGDLPAPLDTSSVEQTKVGNLNLDNNLKVGGLLRLGLYTSHPTGTNGNLYYNTSDHKFYGYQNNEWKELGGGAGFWLASGNNIYNTNTGNVGIGTTSPGATLHVVVFNQRDEIFSDGFEDGTLPPFGTEGDANWSVTSATADTGIYSAKAGTITDDQYTMMTITQEIGDSGGIISFARKVSSEEGWDGLSFYIDEVEKAFYSGELDWETFDYNVSAGLHTFQWIYLKDGSESDGSDTAWVDSVQITEGPPPISAIFEKGNVGIGTTSPGAKLEVAGHIWQTGTGNSVFLGEGAGANDSLNYNENVFVGYQAGYSNTTGWNNSAMGNSALYANTTGSGNSAMGTNALYSNTTGFGNTALGYFALYSNTTGYENTALGNHALRTNTTGSRNTALGSYALYSNATSYFNTALGSYALFFNTTGSSNTALGKEALYYNTTGEYNTALGSQALLSNTTGSRNTALGFSAGRYISGGSASNATSTNSVYLGYDTRALASGDTNEIVIGASTTGFGSNTAAYGNSSMTKHIFQKGNVGIGTTAPDSTLELAGSNAALSLNENTATPATPASGAEARIYMKADKLIIQYNDAGTVRYKYLTLTGTGVTWTHTTTAP